MSQFNEPLVSFGGDATILGANNTCDLGGGSDNVCNYGGGSHNGCDNGSGIAI